jgi:hypothetical protein
MTVGISNWEQGTNCPFPQCQRTAHPLRRQTRSLPGGRAQAVRLVRLGLRLPERLRRCDPAPRDVATALDTTAGNFQKARPPSSVSGEVSRDYPGWAAELCSSESGDPERSVRGVREHAQTMLRLRLRSLEGAQAEHSLGSPEAQRNAARSRDRRAPSQQRFRQ